MQGAPAGWDGTRGQEKQAGRPSSGPGSQGCHFMPSCSAEELWESKNSKVEPGPPGLHKDKFNWISRSAEHSSFRIEIITPISPHPVLGQEMVSKWGQRLLWLLYICQNVCGWLLTWGERCKRVRVGGYMGKITKPNIEILGTSVSLFCCKWRNVVCMCWTSRERVCPPIHPECHSASCVQNKTSGPMLVWRFHPETQGNTWGSLLGLGFPCLF